MKLKFDAASRNRSQPDPFIFEDNGRFYLYVTAGAGVEAYSAPDPFGEWKYEGVVGTVEGGQNFWAPSIVKYEGKYYIYVSCDLEGVFEHMQVMESDSPLGPFGNAKKLYDEFSIDSHVVETADGLFLWYAKDNRDTDRIGTRVYVDRLLDPYTPENKPAEKIVPTFDEEIFMRNRFGDGKDWHTIEGAFWFEHEGWQYVMYSGACYQNDTYHIGYASAKTDETDLTKVDYTKHTDGGKFDPVMTKNDWEEGVGHHSVLFYGGEFYAVYHGRDAIDDGSIHGDRRTARICRLCVKDGIITVERYEDRV